MWVMAFPPLDIGMRRCDNQIKYLCCLHGKSGRPNRFGSIVCQTLTSLYQLMAEGQGQYPAGSLTLSSDGKTLYGVTFGGGANEASVFSIPVAGKIPTVLPTFNGENGAVPCDGLVCFGLWRGMPSGGGARWRS